MQADKGRVSWLWGRFENKELEQEYLHSKLVNTRSIWRGLLLLVTCLFLLLVVGNAFLSNQKTSLPQAAIGMGLALLVLFLNLYVIDRQKSTGKILLYTTAMEVLFLVAYFITAYSSYPINLSLRAFDTLFIVICIYLVPNHFISNIVMALCSYMVFLFSALFGNISVVDGMREGLAVYLLLMLVLCTAVSLHMQVNDRKSFYSDKRLKEMLLIDPLTGAYNLRKMTDEMEKWLPFSARYNLPFSIITIDVDNFKQINDTSGHVYGDQILKDLVRGMLDTVREQDILVRTGGDELMVLLPNTDEKSAVQIAQRLLRMARNYDFHPTRRITCSMGVASWKPNMTARQLRDLADQRLYMAKNHGKNRIVSTDEAIYQ